jgi:hypothetical protein
MKHSLDFFKLIGSSLRNAWRTLRGFTKDPYIDWVIVLIVLVSGFALVVTYGFWRFQKTQNLLSANSEKSETVEKPYFKVEELKKTIESIKAREVIRQRIEANESIQKITF